MKLFGTICVSTMNVTVIEKLITNSLGTTPKSCYNQNMNKSFAGEVEMESKVVLLDTVDLSDPDFQAYLKEHDILASGPENAEPGQMEVIYAGTQEALEQMIDDCFGCDDYLKTFIR